MLDRLGSGTTTSTAAPIWDVGGWLRGIGSRVTMVAQGAGAALSAGAGAGLLNAGTAIGNGRLGTLDASDGASCAGGGAEGISAAAGAIVMTGDRAGCF